MSHGIVSNISKFNVGITLTGHRVSASVEGLRAAWESTFSLLVQDAG